MMARANREVFLEYGLQRNNKIVGETNRKGAFPVA